MSLQVDWKSPHTRRLCVSYAQDWVLVVIMAAIFYGIDKVQPYHREFSLQDKSLMYTHAPEDTVPMWAVYILCLVAPIIFIAIGSLGFRRSVADFHHGVLGLCLGLSLCCMLTVAIKVTTGRPRPDLIDRCQPRPDAADPPLGLSNYTICTTPMDTYEMIDGFKSFPSGHSSFSFAGLAYLSFYLAGKMRLFDGRGHTYKGFIFAIPLLGATLVAISRTRDYRHHWQDVFIGSLLGIACAYFAYRQYHPPLYDLHCHKAYHIRFAPSSNSRADHYLNNNPGNLEAGIAGDSSRLLVDDTLQSRDAHYSQYQDNGYSGESRSPVNIQTYDNNSNKL